ncbi:L-arabinose isomerase [Tessaracoccus palaemonis]|uniref:L-arabinose isomerase n=1 Tax=Tessaracoccus palaemonis TaxID=2829499 RepID=A0ABX8SEY3_9ACTN|nr:L-arabinose isomerase [Tessaracoccus palaemonis]QXT61835.1 L-arabinose isomerase [Tessaracoccus palaemonis]
MENPYAGRKVWFFTGSQDLYGPEVLQQVEEQARQVVADLNASDEIPFEIEWRPTLKDRVAIQRAMVEANADESVVGVICWMHTFSPAKMWILGLDALAKPMLHLHTQANEALPWDTIDMDFMNLNQAAHGDREFGYIVSRLGKQRKIVVGHASHADVQHKVAVWARAATGWAELRTMKLARFGDNMRNVAVTEGDKTEAEHKLGVSINTWGVNEVVAAVEAVSDADVDALVATYEDLYDVAPELRKGGDRHESLRYGARQEIAMRGFLESVGAKGFTDTFEDLGGLRQLPGLAAQRLMADGYGFGAEGDWKTAILVRLAKVMGYGLPGGASLMEDYTYELTPGKQKILGAHMLEVCPSLTTSKPTLEIHPLGIGDREDPVRLVFNTDPGEAIVVAMSDLRDRFRLTANVVDVVEPDQPLPKLPVARAVWEPRPNLSTSAECWITAGAAHHTVMSTAAGLEHFEDFSDMADIELALIDENTTTRGFAAELRYNAAVRKFTDGLR